VTQARRALIGGAAAPYRLSGRFAWHFARGKLRRDPVFTALVERGWIPSGAYVLDLGCGQGLLAAWLAAAQRVWDQGAWPTMWPSPPTSVRVRGIELMPADVRRARAALGEKAQIECADIREAGFGKADVVVILDVLHYMDYATQDSILMRARAALEPRGTLLLRVGDAAGGLRFRFSHWVDKIVTVARGHRLGPLYCRGIDEWRRALERLEFDVEGHPMSARTPFANVLLVCRLSGPPTDD
jgi:SAM-dependent methyltransferase